MHPKQKVHLCNKTKGKFTLSTPVWRVSLLIENKSVLCMASIPCALETCAYNRNQHIIDTVTVVLRHP